MFYVGFLWSWRGSNPRPNRGHLSFLHAYFSLDCRALPRPEPPSNALSSGSSSGHRGIHQTISDLPAPPVPQSRNNDLGVMSCQTHLGVRLSQWSTVLRSGSKSVVSLANYISPSWIIVIGDVSLHAYTKAHPAVKASQPRMENHFFWIAGAKIRSFCDKSQIFECQNAKKCIFMLFL